MNEDTIKKDFLPLDNVWTKIFLISVIFTNINKAILFTLTLTNKNCVAILKTNFILITVMQKLI